MKPFILFLTALGLSLAGVLQSQTQVLAEEFTGTIPTGWSQGPASSWSYAANYDPTGGGCVFTKNVGSQSDSAFIQTPVLNFSGVTSLTVTFKAARVTNNFLSPDVTLSYSTAAGAQFLARWGNGFTSNTTYTVADDASDYVDPLDAQHVVWHVFTHTASIAGSASASLVFEAEMYNGGYVVLDSIRVRTNGSPATALREETDAPVMIFPNPANDRKIRISQASFKSLGLVNLLGEKMPVQVRPLTDSGSELYLDDLVKGVYYLEAVTEDDQRVSRKIIVE